MTTAALLARGPWTADQVTASWLSDRFDPGETASAAADAAIAALRERGSPSHDGLSARLAGHRVNGGTLELELQPARWALRLLSDDALGSMAALCVVRDELGRWLAGRRAAWLASWPGRWALGAGGAVDLGEQPAATLTRELHEEWKLEPRELAIEALVRLPHGLVMLVGQAVVAANSEVVPDDEHDAFAWWPADPADWPAEADEPLRRMAGMLAGR